MSDEQTSAPEQSEMYRRGSETRTRVMGPGGAERRARMRKLHPDLERHLIENAWGQVNSRPGLDIRTRELITVGILLALGREREAAGHIGGALNVGVTREELVELLIHCTAYAGFPTMVTGVELLIQALEARGEFTPADGSSS
jgi:4-carboxymuconolactone decarboxylase